MDRYLSSHQITMDNIIEINTMDLLIELAKKTAENIGALLEKEPFPTKETLERLDAEFIRDNLSPGGTADLLALVYMLHFLKEESHE